MAGQCRAYYLVHRRHDCVRRPAPGQHAAPVHQARAAAALAGYTAYPHNGTVDYVQAEWVVPAVNCLASPQDSRAAVWIGMTGGTTSIHDKTAWLPQIGTVSQCEGLSPVAAPAYMFTCEMFTTPNQASVHEEYGYTHTAHFHVYGDLPEHYVPSYGTVAYVSALDHIHASVAFISSTASGQRTFEIKLTLARRPWMTLSYRAAAAVIPSSSGRWKTTGTPTPLTHRSSRPSPRPARPRTTTQSDGIPDRGERVSPVPAAYQAAGGLPGRQKNRPWPCVADVRQRAS